MAVPQYVLGCESNQYFEYNLYLSDSRDDRVLHTAQLLAEYAVLGVVSFIVFALVLWRSC